MKPNKSQPSLKVYFINNEYLSTCNICLYNIPKKEAKNGVYQYGYSVQKFQLGKHKYNVNISLTIPQDEYYNFFKYGIMQSNKLSYCEVFNNREETFCLNIWLHSVKEIITDSKFKIQEDNSFFTASVRKFKSKKKIKTKTKVKTEIKTKKKPKRNRRFEEEPSSPLSAAPSDYYKYMKKQRNIYRANLFRPFQGGSWTPR